MHVQGPGTRGKECVSLAFGGSAFAGSFVFKDNSETADYLSF